MRYNYLSDSDPLAHSLAILYNLINTIEFIVADCECEDVDVYIDIDVIKENYFIPHKVCIKPKGCVYRCDNYPKELDILSEYFGCYARLGIFDDECKSVLKYENLISLSKDVLRRLTISYLQHYILKTKLTKVEFMMLVNRFGKLIIIEGEADKVSLPLSFKTLKNIVISSHTHPSNCIPSHKDLEQLELIMSYGGLGGAILGPSCITIVNRRKPFIYDDLLRLRKMEDKIKEGNLKEFLKIIKDLESVEITFAYPL